MQPVLNRSSVLDDPNRLDPPDVFCSLGSLIVEGRVPCHNDRGYGEGPHVPPPRNIQLGRHECSEDNFMCKRDENFRKHLLLLWQNSVPISIEVLLCSDCRSGEGKSAPSVKFSSIPEPGAILLEQWTVSINSQSPSKHQITSRGLFQAVRSFLHFSQLSAWYSSTRGQEPKNVFYRITIPGENFSTKFSQTSIEEHFFPPASVGQSSSVYVSVRSLPRRSEIPRVECHHSHSCINNSNNNTDQEEECQLVPNDGEERKLPMAGALSWKEADHSETDLRKAIVKTRLAECTAAGIVSGLDRSDSMDSILGNCLLDPPQSLQKIPPKRYQSPSRCGSPSLEAPDHLLFGSSSSGFRKREPDLGSTGSARRARQDLLRRRDLNLYHGLHPRVLDQQHQNPSGLQMRRTSTPLNMNNLKPTTGPCRAYPRDASGSSAQDTDGPYKSEEDDITFVPCTHSGKRSCVAGCRDARSPYCLLQSHLGNNNNNFEMDFSLLDTNKSDAPSSTSFDDHATELTRGLNNISLIAKTKQNRDTKIPDETETEEVGDDGDEVVEYPTDPDSQGQTFLFQREMQDLLASLSPKQSTCSSRRSSIKEDDSLFAHPTSSKLKGKHVDNIFDDGSCHSQQRFQPLNSVTQVYRAETSSQQQPQQRLPHQQPTSHLPPPLEKSEILLGAILRTSERNRHLEDPEQVETSFEARRFDNRDLLNWVTTPKGQNVAGATYIDDKLRQFRDKIENETGHPETSWCEKSRLRSRSENISASSHSYEDESGFVEPLDISLDEKNLDLWCPWSSINNDGHYMHSPDDDGFKIPNTGLYCNQEDNANADQNCNKENYGNNFVPSTDQVNTFLKSFDSATCMVFHGRTGLPLTSSPAPLRRGKGKFDYDSAISSPHDIKRALFQSQLPERLKKIEEHEKIERRRRHSQKLLSASAPATITSTNLLCNFEESVLNGRLEPVSTVEGFTAEIGASGSFHPKHTVLPVTVFFYTLCDNATVSSPYLGHINLGKKGYRVPQKGTIQVTLFNPLGTVVKMFVVMYDLSDMPPNSQTFLRQRTLYMPSDLSEANNEDAQKWLRYLVHLRFASSKSGKIYLHTDVRMIIFRKSDLDTATDHNQGKGYELRSFTRGPTNPKFSPRK